MASRRRRGAPAQPRPPTPSHQRGMPPRRGRIDPNMGKQTSDRSTSSHARRRKQNLRERIDPSMGNQTSHRGTRIPPDDGSRTCGSALIPAWATGRANTAPGKRSIAPVVNTLRYGWERSRGTRWALPQPSPAAPVELAQGSASCPASVLHRSMPLVPGSPRTCPPLSIARAALARRSHALTSNWMPLERRSGAESRPVRPLRPVRSAVRSAHGLHRALNQRGSFPPSVALVGVRLRDLYGNRRRVVRGGLRGWGRRAVGTRLRLRVAQQTVPACCCACHRTAGGGGNIW